LNIYVEIQIRAPMEKLWEYTQTPDLHARWDLRFSTIEYLPRPDPAEPQRFLYATRIGFGLAIRGKGETVGGREDATGKRTSALKFWSDNPVSLIREGSGYWQYDPSPDGIRFLTEYCYQTRFGWFGHWFDRLLFRPLMGWATAWSFDCLRLWLENHIAPAISLERSLTHAISRLTLALIWIYQGIVPKLLFPDTGEFTILRHTHLFPGHEPVILSLIGIAELLFGILLLVLWNVPRLLQLNILALLALTASASLTQPALFVAPFNPLTLNLAMIALSAIALITARHLPTSRHCLRHRPTKPVSDSPSPRPRGEGAVG